MMPIAAVLADDQIVLMLLTYYGLRWLLWIWLSFFSLPAKVPAGWLGVLMCVMAYCVLCACVRRKCVCVCKCGNV